MLKIENLNVYYGAFHVLQGINLEIHEGEIVTLLGGNGAGKTTTIKTVSGLNRPKSGSIVFQGESLIDMPVYKRVEAGIIQVPEGRKLFPEMSVMDNLMVGSFLKKTHATRKENMELCFKLFPKLYERREQLAGSLSGGEQQMCAIARGLMQNPKLLMLDEPSLGLAPVVIEDVFRIIKEINQLGVTILLVEQNVGSALEIADRAYVIEMGCNVLNGSAEELLHDSRVKEAYLGI